MAYFLMSLHFLPCSVLLLDVKITLDITSSKTFKVFSLIPIHIYRT